MNKFEQGTNRLDKVSKILGPELNTAIQNIFGESQTLHLVENVYKDYPMMARVAAAKSDEELLALYQTAAKNITNINSENFHENALTDLSQKLYDASYGFIAKNPKLNHIRGQWNNATIEQRKDFCNAVVDNLSKAFDVPRPELFFQTGRQLPVNGFSYDGTIFMNIGNDSGALGLIVHEFTHHLQSHDKTPMGHDAVHKTRENYVLSAFLPADKRDKFHDFVFKNIYSNSLLEREAIFTGNWVKQHFREMQNRTQSEKTQTPDVMLKINEALNGRSV